MINEYLSVCPEDLRAEYREARRAQSTKKKKRTKKRVPSRTQDKEQCE